jgi:pilus assembly protein CpaE
VGVMSESEMTGRNWTVHTEDGTARIILSESETASASLATGQIAGFGIVIHMLDADAPIPEDVAKLARVLIVEVRPNDEASLRRLLQLRADYPQTKTIAAVRDASVPIVRALLKSGVSDIIALPLTRDDLTSALAQIREDLDKSGQRTAGIGKIISFVRSVGGVGATTLATQAAALQANRDAAAGRETCLIDLDLQFGNAATYLGLSPTLTIADLIEAGSRVDQAMIRTAVVKTQGGLNVLAAPPDIAPLEAASTDQIFHLVDLATREFGTVMLDFPGTWTNWSLSLVGRSDVIVLVIELTVASLRQARRQLTLLANQGLGDVPTLVVANRVEKRLFRSINLGDAEDALNHPVAFGIANDFPLISTALDQGVVIGDIKPKSKVSKDILALLDGCDEMMGRTR